MKVVQVVQVFQIVLMMMLCFIADLSARPLTQNTSLPLVAINTVDLVAMDEHVYTQPWLTYQSLLELEPQLTEMKAIDRLWWLMRKAQCENLLYFYNDFNQSLEKALAAVDASTPLEIQARLAHFTGLSQQRDGKYQSARREFKRAMTLADQGDLHHIYIEAKLERAYTYSFAELFETSLQDMQEAYVEAFALNDHFLIAMINETYGAIYGYMRQNERSIEYYEKALASYERLGYKAHIAEAIYGLASTYRYWKKYDLAIEKFKLYQRKTSYTPNTNLSYFGAYGLGMTMAEKGDCQAAITVIDQAFLMEGLDDYDAELYKRKASCLIQLNQLEQAQQALTAAENIFAKFPELDGTAWTLETVKISGHLAFAHGNYQQAYRLLDSYYQDYTQVLIESASSRVANIRASMELERQEVEKALSSQRYISESLEVKTREQEALQQRYFIIFLLTLLLIVVAVAVYQYKSNRKMAALSIVDSLSGLYNRRYIFGYLDKLIAGTSSEKGELSILVVDIDDFKEINDSYGHPTGDMIIEQVARLALKTLRAEDVMGRIGGEEFLCVLPRTDLEQSQIIADRMREKVAQHEFINQEGEVINVTLSFGITKLSSNEQSSKELYSHADKALYQAKHEGKNCAVVYQE